MRQSQLARLNGALAVLGFAPEFVIRSPTDFVVAHAVWKDRVVAARRSGNIPLETVLNSAYAIIKPHRERYCPICGSRKGHTGRLCGMCHRRRSTFGDNIMANSFTEFQLEQTPVIVPPALKGANSQLALALDKLCHGQVGDSFIARRQPSAIAFAAKVHGLKVICRCVTPDEKDYKKRAYRVWRSDGHNMDELNRLIQRRLNGETVETLPLTPPPAEVLEAIKNTKHPKSGRPRTVAA